MSQDEVSQQADAVQISQGKILNITLLASEWKSSAGGLSTLNRELAIHLSQVQNVRVSLLVPEGACNDEDKRVAGRFGISILDARKCVGVEPLLWLGNPPQDHKIDVIVGHGVKLGCQVQFIKGHIRFQNCKWLHVVYTVPEDLSKYKGYCRPISRGEKKHWGEVDLCKCADLVVPVGPRVTEAYHSYLKECKKDEDFFELIPGLFDREFGGLNQTAKKQKDNFIVLLCGRGDEEDFELKGYDIAVKAFADQRLEGKRCSLLFVGSPEGKQDEVWEKLLCLALMDKKQLTVKEFVKIRERMKDLFCEVDMVMMPSKSEEFGLVALEALSAGLPILVGNNSGFARALEKIPIRSFSIIDSEDPAKWAEAIQSVRDRHGVALQDNKMLKYLYSKEYCWKAQCKKLVDRLWKMVYETSAAQAVPADDLVEQCPNAVPESDCQPDSTPTQQHIERGAVTSGRGNGINTGEVVKMQRSEQQLPSVSSESFYEPHSVHLSETKDEEKALAAFKNKQDVREVGGETKTNKTKTKINRPRNKLEQKLVVEQSSENKINPLRNKLELTKIAGQSLQKEISELLDELEQKRIAEESSETEINGLPNELKQEGIVEQMSKTEINRLRGKLEQERICFDQPQSQIENEWVINSRDIHVSGEKLGEGAWGIVYKGKFHGCGVAVKQFQEAINNASRRLFTREVNMASKCRHPCLLLFIGAIMDERPSLVIELMECSLRSKLFPDRGEEMLAKADESVISLDVALALHYLHEKKPHPILHNDVSSSNVLLWRSATHWRAKLSDYGSANIVRLTNLNCAGAAVYCAPKFTDADAVISCKADVYSYGVLLCEMSIRQTPNPEQRGAQINRIGRLQLRALVRRCVQRTPSWRPDMKEVIEDLNEDEQMIIERFYWNS